MEKLYTSQTGNESSKGNAIVSTGRELTVQAWGTWDTAILSVYLAVSAPASNSGVLLPELTFTADDMVAVQVPAGNYVWAVLSSVGGATDVSLWINGQGND